MKNFLICIILGYFFFVGGLYFFQRDLLFPAPHDARTLQDIGASHYQEIETMALSGHVIKHWFHRGVKDQVLVFFHGNADSRAQVVPKLQPFVDAGYGVMIVAYSGYNEDKAPSSEKALLEDARHALSALTKFSITPEDVVLYGQSLGTGIAVAMAEEKRGSVLILESPYTSIADVAAFHYPYVPARLLIKDPFDSLSRMKGVHMPVLMISGSMDEVVPHRYSRALFEAAHEPKEAFWIEGAGHGDLEAHGSRERVLLFLESSPFSKPLLGGDLVR